MAEFEPTKIWAVTGLMVVSIYGMTVVQLRSSGASISPLDLLTKSSSETEPTNAQSPGSTEYSVYAAGYSGGGRSAYHQAVSLNPFAYHVSPTFFRPVVSVSNGSDEEADVPDSDMAQEIVNPEYAMTDVAEISGDLRAGVSPPYGAVDVVASDSLAQATYLTYLPPPTAIDGFITFNDDVQIFDVAVDEPTNVTLDDVVLDVTGSMDTDLSEAFAANNGSVVPNVYATNSGLIYNGPDPNALRWLTLGGRNLSSSNMSSAQAMLVQQALSQTNMPQAMLIQQAMAVQQAQADGLNAAYQQAQGRYQQQAQEEELVLGGEQQSNEQSPEVDQIISKGYKYAVNNGQNIYW